MVNNLYSSPQEVFDETHWLTHNPVTTGNKYMVCEDKVDTSYHSKKRKTLTNINRKK